jgi:hypothetical protein
MNDDIDVSESVDAPRIDEIEFPNFDPVTAVG